MLWSRKKHWVLGAESPVDLAELAALQTLLSIAQAVRGVYPNGMFFQLDLADIEFEFMEKQDDAVVEARERYISGLRRLIEALHLCEIFTLGKVSEYAKSAEELRSWWNQMVQNHKALATYWYESEGLNFSQNMNLRSFKEINRLGWKGTIPPEMRKYYLYRLRTLADSHNAQKVDMVLRNFAGILLHRQIGLFADPVRSSFVPPADSVPRELLVGCVDLRFVPRNVCSRVSAAAPWSTKGFVCQTGDHIRVSFRGWHELADSKCRFTEGYLGLGNGNGTAEIRADFLHQETENGNPDLKG